MKKIAIAALMVGVLTSVYGSPRQQRQRPLQPVRPAVRRAIVEDAVLAFYIKQFQQVVTPEVFAKILPSLQQFVQDRFDISQRRTRALNQLRQALNRESTEDELRRLVRDLDAADAEFQTNQQRFFSNVDPLLNVRQQARVRILQNMADNRIREYLNAVQTPAPAGQPQNPPPNQ
jgi:hypothetical protein